MLVRTRSPMAYTVGRLVANTWASQVMQPQGRRTSDFLDAIPATIEHCSKNRLPEPKAG